MRIPLRFVSFGLIALSLSLGKAADPPAAPSPAASPSASKPPKELRELTYSDAQRAFVDPASQEPYSGPIIVKYPDGTPETVGNLKAGREEGTWSDFYEDGTKSSAGDFADGQEHGPWTYWWDNGKVEAEGEYDQGKMTGRWRDFYPDGTLASDGSYVNGRAEGKWLMHDEETGVTATVWYRDGEEVPPPADAEPSGDPKTQTSPSENPSSPTPAPGDPTID